MNAIMLDTNFITALFQGDSSILELMLSMSAIYMSVIVIGELEAGFRGGNRYKENLNHLDSFLSRSSVAILPISRTTSNYFGLIKNALKRNGTPIPINDIWLAAQSIEHKLVLATYDKHFTLINGVELYPGISQFHNSPLTTHNLRRCGDAATKPPF